MQEDAHVGRSIGAIAMVLAATCAAADSGPATRLAELVTATCSDLTLDFAGTRDALLAAGLADAVSDGRDPVLAVCEAVGIREGDQGDPLPAEAKVRDDYDRCAANGHLTGGTVAATAVLASADGDLRLTLRRVTKSNPARAFISCHLTTALSEIVLPPAFPAEPDLGSSNALGTARVWMSPPVIAAVFEPTSGTLLDSLRPDMPMPTAAAFVTRSEPGSGS